jgi:Ferric uptake regulator family
MSGNPPYTRTKEKQQEPITTAMADAYVDPGASTKLWDACAIDALVTAAAAVFPTSRARRSTTEAHPSRTTVVSSSRSLTPRVSPGTVPIARARLMEMRIIPGMRAGSAAHDARPPGVESAEVALRGRGFRLTAPRHAVLEVVRGIKTHPTAEEVHRLVLRRAPGVSLGTATGTSGCSSTRGCSVNCPGHEPASTPTPGPIITSSVSAAGASRTTRHRWQNRTRGRCQNAWRPALVSRSRITGSTSSVVAGSARRRGALGRADVVRRRMPVLAPLILPRRGPAGGMVTDWVSGRIDLNSLP